MRITLGLVTFDRFVSLLESWPPTRRSNTVLFAIPRLLGSLSSTGVSMGFSLSASLRATALSCIASASLAAQAPTTGQRWLDHPIVIGADWLQATALPLNRAAAQSISGDISWRTTNWAFNGGWLRIARDLSTVQGVTLSAGRILRAGPVNFIPALSVLGGEAYVSFDSTGYDFTSGGVTGHVPRYSYSNGFTFGGGAGLSIEVPIYQIVGFRLVGSEWVFSGNPVAEERTRGVVGAGLTIRVR
jgi:hypothetical protein